jgi:hypothetical protein
VVLISGTKIYFYLKRNMNAEIARRHTDNAHSTHSKMEKIFSIIRKSAENGLDFIILESLDSDCTENLLDLGYQIYFSEDKKTITIEW